MKITAGTLLLVVAVFLDSIKLISSVEPAQTTLAQLFPGYNGALPPIRIFTHPEERQYPNLQEVSRRFMRRSMHCPLVAIGHVVFGWVGSDSLLRDHRGHYLQPLWKLFSGLSNQNRLVFDTTKENPWVTLPENEFDQLGFGRVWPLVRARQAVAASTKRTDSGSPLVNYYAHIHAYEEANRAIDQLEATFIRRIGSNGMSVYAGGPLITQRYRQAYNTAFGNYVGNAHFGWNQ